MVAVNGHCRWEPIIMNFVPAAMRAHAGAYAAGRRFSTSAYHRTVSTPCRYNLPVVALSRLYSPQFWQTAAGAPRKKTTVLPPRKATETAPRALCATLPHKNLISGPVLTTPPSLGVSGIDFGRSAPKP